LNTSMLQLLLIIISSVIYNIFIDEFKKIDIRRVIYIYIRDIRLVIYIYIDIRFLINWKLTFEDYAIYAYDS
jgi:hypothetical protein